MTDVKINGISLHSAYSPENEARRYLDSRGLNDESAVYVLPEPGLGYLSAELRHRFPLAKIIELHCTSAFEDHFVCKSALRWVAGSGVTLNSFLHSHIPDSMLGRVRIVEWPPAARAFGESYSSLRNELLTFLQERRASLHTTGIFGRKWMLNTFKRMLRTEVFIRYEGESRPVVICAGGPSLEQALPLLLRLQNRVSIWALPSALHALEAGGIIPEVTVHSDAGYYAGYHLRPLQNISGFQMAPLYSSWTREFPVPLILLNTHSPVDDFILGKIAVSSVNSIPHGTVAGTAMGAAYSVTSGPVIFAGLDLAFSDVLSHVRPHSFDPLFQAACHRFEPLLQIHYRRSPRAESSLDSSFDPERNYALKRYGGWFSRLSPQQYRRMYRLFPSKIGIPAFQNLYFQEDLLELVKVFPGKEGEKSSLPVDFDKRRNALHAYLEEIGRQKEIFMQKTADCEITGLLIEMPLLEEFITRCCYADLIGLVQKDRKDDRKKAVLLGRIEDMMEELLKLTGEPGEYK